MGGPTHQWVGAPIVTHGTNKGSHSSGGQMGEQCTRTHCQRGEPIGCGPIKTHCTAMDSVAANRRLKDTGPITLSSERVPGDLREVHSKTNSAIEGVLSEVPGCPLRDPLRDTRHAEIPQILSEPLRACCPCSCCPLKLLQFLQLCVNSQYLKCETTTSLFGQVYRSANFSQYLSNFSRFLPSFANFSRFLPSFAIFSRFWANLADFSQGKAGELTIERSFALARLLLRTLSPASNLIQTEETPFEALQEALQLRSRRPVTE